MGTHPFMMLLDGATAVASGLSIVFLCKTLLNILNKQGCESTSISRKKNPNMSSRKKIHGLSCG
jgi:hypothetical protein